jgi:excisionase family DNA binding protein
MDRQLKVEEIAKILGIAEYTARRYFQEGRFKGSYKIGLDWRLAESDLVKWIESKKGK